MTEYTIGIDISKPHLDAFNLEEETAKRFENSPRGFRALVKWLDAAQIARIVFEPTGPIHRAFEESLSGKLPLVKVNPLKARRFTTLVALVERQITELDAEIAKYIAEDQSTARKRDILCSMPGLGPVSAAIIIAFLPETGTLGRKQAGSIAGLAPYNRESGIWKGRSVISGRRKPIRDALYMPALVAMRFNPDLQAKYSQLRAAGKPAKVAIVAIIRKLLETANALVKAHRFWVEKKSLRMTDTRGWS